MHRIRKSVRENQLSDPGRVVEADYLAFVANGSVWVAETGDGITGFAAIEISAGYVWALFVSPDAEGAGVGDALHAYMLDWAQAHDLRHLRLSTTVGTRAERFYTARGWTRTGVNSDGEAGFERSIVAQQPSEPSAP